LSWDWLRTRLQKGVTSAAATPRFVADVVDAGLQALGRAVGAPETGKSAGLSARAVIPGGFSYSADAANARLNQITGRKDVNAPASWGLPGRALDAATEAAAGSLVMPFGGWQGAIRGLVPAAIGGAASEVAGDTFKGARLEVPARVVAGLLGGTVGAGAQNAVTSTAQGVANIVGANARNAERQAARILGRNLAADRTTMPELITRHGEFLPGTPLAATAGPNVRGAVRGAFTLQGPARDVVERGANQFIEGADARVAPVLNRMSPLPPAEVRVPQLMAQAAADAPPIYRQAGVADLPQQILTRQPGAPTTVPSAILGPDGKPLMTTRPGPTVTTVQTNSPVLQRPELAQFMTESGDIQRSINRARDLPAFRNEPATSMAMIDKVYKDLGSLESTANRAGDYGRARDIGIVRRQLAQHIEAENPIYGRALQAYAEPASLAEAAQLGQRLARESIDPREVRRQFDELASDTHRREFLGGFVGYLRGKAGSTDRATPAERFWNNDYTRGKVAELFPTVTNAGPDNTFQEINRALQNEREAARNLRDITKGSTTANKAGEMSDLAGGEAGGVLSELLHKGVKGAVVSKLLEKVGALSDRAVEGRTQAVNEALARMTMQIDPVQIARTQGLVEAARRQAEATASARRFGFSAGAGAGGLLNQPGPADRIMQGLLMGGP
jgi:hypothetical protein